MTAPALRIERVDELDVLRDEWTELAERTRNVFATWEFSSLWWRHFASDGRALTFACRAADGRLVAVLPLYVWAERPIKIVRFIAHGPGDQLGPICADEDRAAVARALRTALADADLQLLVGEQLPGDADWSGLLGGKVLRTTGNPLLRFDGASWEDFVASKSSNFREQVRRRERKLGRAHELRFRLADDPRRLDADLTTLFALHAARWQEADSSFGGSNEPFHREFATCAFRRGWLRLWLLEVDGVPRAAWYGLRFGGVEAYYQAGRDPEWDRFSVGFVLLTHSVREAMRDGMDEYRFLRGGETYKYRFANVDGTLETIAVPRGLTGRLALAATAALPAAAVRRLPV